MTRIPGSVRLALVCILFVLPFAAALALDREPPRSDG